MTTQSASTRRGQQGRRAQHRARPAVARRLLGRRPTARFAVLVTVLLATLISGAAPAAAHPTLLTTEPGTDAAVPDSPAAVVVVFNEAVTAGPDALSVLTGTGRAVPVGSAATARDGFAVITRPAAALPPGSYTVRWRVTGADGDPVEGEFRFAVGPAISGSGSAGGVSSVVWASAVLRWMLFAGLAIAVGGVVGERFTSSARAVNPSLPAVRSQALPGLFLAAAGVLGLGAVLVAETGTVGAMWQGRGGQLLLAEAAGLLLALGLAIGRRRWAAIACGGSGGTGRGGPVARQRRRPVVGWGCSPACTWRPRRSGWARCCTPRGRWSRGAATAPRSSGWSPGTPGSRGGCSSSSSAPAP